MEVDLEVNKEIQVYDYVLPLKRRTKS